MSVIEPGIYQHFKGERYRVIGVGRHSETELPLVCYQCLYGDFDLWLRPLDNFLSPAEVDGVAVTRFEWLQPLSTADWLALGKALVSSAAPGSSNSEL